MSGDSDMQPSNGVSGSEISQQLFELRKISSEVLSELKDSRRRSEELSLQKEEVTIQNLANLRNEQPLQAPAKILPQESTTTTTLDPNRHFERDPKIMYLIRTYPATYDTRIKWMSETWLSAVPREQILIVGVNASYQQDQGNIKRINYPGLEGAHIIYPECRNHNGNVNKGQGLCCQEAAGLVEAAKYDFDWLFLIDDDIFVVPHNLTKALREIHPDSWDIAGAWGCGPMADYDQFPDYRWVGFCGGTGYAISKRGLQALIQNDEAAFRVEYRLYCQPIMACDIVTGVMATKRNLRVKNFVFHHDAIYHKLLEFEMYKYHRMFILGTEPIDKEFINVDHWKLVGHDDELLETIISVHSKVGEPS